MRGASQDQPQSISRALTPELDSNAVDVLPEGRLQQQLASGKVLRVKLGIDPTAPDIHLGHAVVLTKLRQFQDQGHTVVLIIGDFTALVGDPSGRSAQRPMLTPEQIADNATTFTDQAFKILDSEKTEVRFNSEWLNMNTQDMFALLATTTVAQLLERNDFQQRMAAGKPVSMLEMIYPLLQGYDSVAVDADVEIGGTDQKFNLLLARDIQKEMNSELEPQSILTMPVLPGTDGVNKMSKALSNYIAITDSPKEMFGKTMSIPDEVMPQYYQLLLDCQQPEVPANQAKRQLAKQLITRFHSAEDAVQAEAAFDRVHVHHQAPEDIPEVSVSEARVHLPALLADNFSITRGEARRLIKQGGVRINGEKVDAGTLDVDALDLDNAVVKAGRQHLRAHVDGS